MDLRTKCMQFLYKWVTDGKIPQIRKGQVEELQSLILNELAAAEIAKSTAKMMAAEKETKDA